MRAQHQTPGHRQTAARTGTGRLVATIVAIIFAAGMLRTPFVSVAPVAGTIQLDLGVGAAVVGLLTSIPVLCFAVCSPLAVSLIRRVGIDGAFTAAMLGALAGCLIRISGGVPALIGGTVVIGAFIAVGNVVVPMIIARDFASHRAHTMTSVFTSALNVGTMSATLTTVPLAATYGWQLAISCWLAFALAALAVWIPLRGLRGALVPQPRPAPHPARRGRSPVLRDLTTWLLAIAFCGQGFGFYAMTAWLPTLLASEGFSAAAAGAISSIFQVGGIADCLLVPVVTRRGSLPIAVLAVGIGWVIVPLGFLFLPAGWLAWCIIGGIAQGGGITLVFIMIGSFGDDEHATAGRSGLVQGVGYAAAATGPSLLGALHETTGGWTLPLLTVLVAALLFLLPGSVVAGRLVRRETDGVRAGQKNAG